jgi:hypothetical protein
MTHQCAQTPNRDIFSLPFVHLFSTFPYRLIYPSTWDFIEL